MRRVATVLSYLPERWPTAVCLGVMASIALTAGVPVPLVFVPLLVAFVADVAQVRLLHRYGLCGCQVGEAAGRR